MRGSSSLVLDGSMVMDKLSKHSSLQHRFENRVNCVVEVLYYVYRVIEHCLRSISCHIEMRVKRFNIDPLTCIKQSNWGDVIRGIQCDEDLGQTVVDGCRCDLRSSDPGSLVPIVLTITRSFLTAVSDMGLCFAAS